MSFLSFHTRRKYQAMQFLVLKRAKIKMKQMCAQPLQSFTADFLFLYVYIQILMLRMIAWLRVRI